MANPRKCIVLCVEVDCSAAASADNFERGLQTVRMPGDLMPEIFYEITNGIVGFVLLVSEFWIFEDLCQR